MSSVRAIPRHRSPFYSWSGLLKLFPASYWALLYNISFFSRYPCLFLCLQFSLPFLISTFLSISSFFSSFRSIQTHPEFLSGVLFHTLGKSSSCYGDFFIIWTPYDPFQTLLCLFLRSDDKKRSLPVVSSLVSYTATEINLKPTQDQRELLRETHHRYGIECVELGHRRMKRETTPSEPGTNELPGISA